MQKMKNDRIIKQKKKKGKRDKSMGKISLLRKVRHEESKIRRKWIARFAEIVESGLI